MRILYIGNSFTARHDLPGLVATLAAAREISVEHELISVGGASLKRHWNAETAVERIRSGEWDAVVLQEQSTLPIKNASRFHENVRIFHPVIQEAGAQTVLYETWARAHAPETQQQLTDAYGAIGDELGALVIPAGQAWKRLLTEPDPPQLHDKDGSHPTLAGSYLAACAFAGTLLKLSLSDLPTCGLPETLAERLRGSFPTPV